MYQVKPLGTRVLVELEPVDERKVESLYLPAKHSDRTRVGTVLDVGDKVTKFKIGDRILLHYMVGVFVYLFENKWLKDTHRIVEEEEIPARLYWVEDENKETVG